MTNITAADIFKPGFYDELRQGSVGWGVAGFTLLLVIFLWVKLLRKNQAVVVGDAERKQPAGARIGKFLREVDIGRLSTLLITATALLLLSNVLAEGFFSTAAHEVGFAVLVSSVIWVIFEAQLRQEADAVWDRRIEHATRNVFQAVLRKDLPKALLDEANNLVLNSSLIRSDFSVTYTLRDGGFDPGDGSTAECVLVDAIMEFGMRNVSTDAVEWTSGLRLPNPVHPNLKQLVRVHSFVVKKGAEDVALELDAAEGAFRTAIEDDNLTAVSYDAGSVTLQPGETCTCATSYTMAKEVEDSEVLQTLHPSDGLRVTIFDQATDGRRVLFARAVHRRSLDSEPSGNHASNARIFRIPGYLLPHQGVLIWWKRNPKPVSGPLPVHLANGSDRLNEEESHG